MLDAIELERRGIPAANLCTDALLTSVSEMCQVQGIPDYPSLVMPHPLSSLSQAELEVRVGPLGREAAEILTGQTRPRT